MSNSQETPSKIDHDMEVAAEETLPRVLVVDDEESITELVSMALRYEGFDVQTAASGYGALEQIDSFRPDLILLDVMLPDIDGFNIAERLRRDRRDIPVLFLTARDATEDKVRGLTIGGDDYVTKPFSVAELVARTQAILRRAGKGGSTRELLELADLEMDDDAHEVRRAGQLIDLTATEYRLLRYLLSNPRRVLTRSQLLRQLPPQEDRFHRAASDPYRARRWLRAPPAPQLTRMSWHGRLRGVSDGIWVRPCR